MRIHLVVFIAALSTTIGIAGADELKPPPTKEGLWETRSTHTLQGKSVSDPPVKMCNRTRPPSRCRHAERR